MRFHVPLFVMTTVFLALFGGVSCNNSNPAVDFFAKQKADINALITQISPAEAPVADSLIVIIPTDETFRRVSDFWLQKQKNEMLGMVEMIRKRHLFNTVQYSQSVDPEKEQFKEDFALIYIDPGKLDVTQQYSHYYIWFRKKNIPEWMLKIHSQTGHGAIPIESGPSAFSRFQQIMIWFDNLESAARTLSQKN